MSGLLFVIDVVAFVITIIWAVGAEAPGNGGERGLLGMRGVTKDEAPARARRSPGWRKEAEADHPTAGARTPTAPPMRRRASWARYPRA